MMKEVVLVNKRTKRKAMILGTLVLLLGIVGCSVTPDVPAPDPVPAPTETQETAETQDTQNAVAEEPQTGDATLSDVTIVTEDYPPFNFINQDGELDGIGTRQVKEGLNRLGLDTEIEVLPWARAYEMAQQQDNVLIFSMTRTDARENMFKWISPLAASEVYFYVLEDRVNEIQINSLEDAKEYVVSAMQDDFTQEELLEAGFEEGVNLSSTPDATMAITQVLRGQTDVFITSGDIEELVSGTEFSANDLAVAYNIEELRSYLYIAASMGTPDHIVEEFREAIPGVE